MPAELIAFTITRLPAAAVVGQAVHYRMGAPDGNPLPALWERMAKDGTLTQLGALPTRILPEVWIGWMGYFNPVENSMLYLAGVLVAPDTEAPAGMVKEPLAETAYAVGTIRGTIPDVFGDAYPLTQMEAIRQARQLHAAAGYAMEWYDSRFKFDEEVKVIDFYLPVLG